MRACAAMALLLLAPTVSASGSLDVGAATVIVDNGKTENCVEGTTGLCPASRHGGALADDEIDADQQLRYIGVAAERDAVNELLGEEVVPAVQVGVHASGARVPNPTFRLLAENVGTHHAPAPADDTAVIMERERFGLAYRGVALGDASGGPTRRCYCSGFSDDRGVTHDSISMYGTLVSGNTDSQVRMWLTAECWAVDKRRCTGVGAAAADAWTDATPNLLFGIHLENAALATDGSLLTQHGVRLGSGALTNGDTRGGSGTVNARPPGLYLPPLERSPDSPPTYSGAASDVSPLPPAPVPEEKTESGIAQPRNFPVSPIALGAALALVVLASAALYSRFTREDALNNERRARIIHLLEAQGPLTIAQLVRTLDVDRTTVTHHVRLLQRTELVHVKRLGKQTLVLLPGQKVPAEPLEPPCAADAILRALRAGGGELTRDKLHEIVQPFAQRSRNEALQRLAASGAIERAFAGNVEVVRLTAPQMRGNAG